MIRVHFAVHDDSREYRPLVPLCQRSPDFALKSQNMHDVTCSTCKRLVQELTALASEKEPKR